jgi:pimeloyl-ACP methyl ester carboxylesterase
MPASPVRLPRQAAALLVLALVPVLPATAAAKLAWKPCADELGFECATLRVPLDRSGQTPGTIGIKVAREDRTVRGGKVLISLTGGPGQGAVAIAPLIEQSMAPALVHHKLVVLDQRGTGDSGVLRCPKLQRSRLLNPFTAALASQCAGALGPKRSFYTTADTVADMDDLRKELGVAKLALQGTSYGTFVAQQYARIHPDHVERLVLDSVVGPDGVDAFLADSWNAVPRILTELCGGDLCHGITTDPVGEMRALAARLEVAPVKGAVVEANGGRRSASVGGVGLISLLVAGDLNAHLRAALPAAVHSALAGDPAALLRMIPAGIGPPLGLKDLSYGLNAATTCTETNLPYALDTPLSDRPQRIADALAALPESSLGPFSRSLVERSSTAEQCRLWPAGRAVLPTTTPLPDVPALILGGRLDTRTPIENGQAVAKELPHSTLITVPGSGHDETDTDLSGCVARATFRFFSNRRIGDACVRTSNAVPPAPVAPTALDQLPPHRGTPGDRGRVLRAAVDTIDDMREQFFQNADGGLPSTRGGGLRGGTWRTRGETGFVLDRLEWCPGVRVSGRLTSRLGRYDGKVRVSAPKGLSGTLRFVRGRGVVGTLGGNRVQLPARAVRGAVEPALQRVLG